MQEHTGLDDLDTKFAGVGNCQMFGVVGNDHHLVQCRVIFFIESVHHDQGGGNPVPVVVMHPCGDTMTAQDLFSEMKRMPSTVRIKFFSLLTNQAFRDDDFTHEQVFGHLQHEPLTALEAAEYLEVSLPTLRRYVQANKLRPCHTVGRNQMFSAEDLRACKRARR